MIKVLVMVSGLVLFVPDGPPEMDPNGVTVLFLDSSVWGLPAHVPQIQQKALPTDLPVPPPIEVQDFDLKLSTPKTGSVTLTAWPHLLSLDEMAPTDGDPRVRKECVEASSACSFNGDPLITGRLRFEGLWRTRPASICSAEWEKPVGYWDQAAWDLRSGKLESSLTPARRLATGIVFEMELTEAELQDFPLLQKRALGAAAGTPWTRVAIPESDPTECAAWFGGAVRCVILDVSSRTGLPSPAGCDQKNPPAHCRADRHFSVYYDLMVESPEAPRLVPYVSDRYFECVRSGDGLGHDPSPRCPPPTGRAEP